MSIAIGESRRDVYVRLYFRGWAVCPRADIEIGSPLASQTPGSPGMCYQQAIWRVRRKPAKLGQTESRRMQA